MNDLSDGEDPRSLDELKSEIEWDEDGFALTPLDEEDNGDYLDRMLAQYAT